MGRFSFVLTCYQCIFVFLSRSVFASILTLINLIIVLVIVIVIILIILFDSNKSIRCSIFLSICDGSLTCLGISSWSSLSSLSTKTRTISFPNNSVYLSLYIWRNLNGLSYIVIIYVKSITNSKKIITYFTTLETYTRLNISNVMFGS